MGPCLPWLDVLDWPRENCCEVPAGKIKAQSAKNLIILYFQRFRSDWPKLLLPRPCNSFLVCWEPFESFDSCRGKFSFIQHEKYAQRQWRVEGSWLSRQQDGSTQELTILTQKQVLSREIKEVMLRNGRKFYSCSKHFHAFHVARFLLFLLTHPTQLTNQFLKRLC